jgi:hypothetical protein
MEGKSMTPAVAGAATGAAEETAQVEKTPSLSEEIVALMEGKELPEPKAEEEVPTKVVGEEDETPPAGTTEETTEEEEDETQPPAAAKKDDWPESARRYKSQQDGKIKKLRGRAETAEEKVGTLQGQVAQLQEQLSQANLPRPTGDDPLADVFDMKGLNKAKGHYQNVREVATQALDENPTSSEIDVIVGKDKHGNEITETFTRKQLSNMKSKAENALNNLIPAKEKSLAAREQGDAIALKVYPEFGENDGDNESAQFVRETLARFPQLAGVPDIVIWLGHTLTGQKVTMERLKKELGKNGKHGASTEKSEETDTVADRIRKGERFKVAPSTSTGRTPSQASTRKGADVAEARKKMEANPGSDEAMEDFIGATLFSSNKKGYDKV